MLILIQKSEVLSVAKITLGLFCFFFFPIVLPLPFLLRKYIAFFKESRRACSVTPVDICGT